MKRYVIQLTELERRMLQLVIGNGWGDGDILDWLRAGFENQNDYFSARRALMRAMDKVDDAPFVNTRTGIGGTDETSDDHNS